MLRYFYSSILIGIQKYGAGNWKDICTVLDSGKKEKQLDEHYWQLYMGKHGVCLPVEYSMDNYFTILDTLDLFPEEPNVHETENEEIIHDSDLFRIPLVPGNIRGERVEDKLLANQSNLTPTISHVSIAGNRRHSHSALPLTAATSTPGVSTTITTTTSTTTTSSAAPLPTTTSSSSSSAATNALITGGGELPGFMPLRDDFETEYENDAELYLADMEFSAEDHPSEVELKLQVIRIYHAKLQQRLQRKQFVLQRQLYDVKKQQIDEKKWTKEERELLGKLRPFARYQSKEEYEQLLKGILQANRLKQQIEMYKIYQQLGCTTLDDVLNYEQQRKTQEYENRVKRDRETAPHLYENTRLVPAASLLGKRAHAALHNNSNNNNNSGDELVGGTQSQSSSNNNNNNNSAMKKRSGRKSKQQLLLDQSSQSQSQSEQQQEDDQLQQSRSIHFADSLSNNNNNNNNSHQTEEQSQEMETTESIPPTNNNNNNNNNIA
jgi:hypothetical protein